MQATYNLGSLGLIRLYLMSTNATDDESALVVGFASDCPSLHFVNAQIQGD